MDLRFCKENTDKTALFEYPVIKWDEHFTHSPNLITSLQPEAGSVSEETHLEASQLHNSHYVKLNQQCQFHVVLMLNLSW